MSEEAGDSLDVIAGETTYRLVRKIAQGGMGAVYEAVQDGAEGFTKRMALKTILPRYSNNPEFIEMFIGEAKLVSDLVQENIVQIYQLGRDQTGSYYIAMEYVDGVNVEEFIAAHERCGRFVPPELATFLAARVCRGLEYAHGKRGSDGQPLGIVHRDVSPKNVLIDSLGTVRLTDFGVAKARQHMNQKEGEALMGRVAFMSPEQAGFLVTDARSDLFSLGMVLYTLLTLTNPFECRELDRCLQRVRSAPIPDPREYRNDIPEELVRIVMRALERDPDRRYASAGSMGHELEYHIYKDGYGPTVQTLSRYMAEILPEKSFADPGPMAKTEHLGKTRPAGPFSKRIDT